jgi:hypothetical protein
VDYPPEGGRETKKNRRRSGTRVTALMPWGKEEAERLLERMPMIRPPEGTEYTVNRKRVERREAEAVHTAVLQSVISAAPGQPLRPTRRRTDIHITGAREETGWLFEMGIPIQEIELPYDVDVQQKVAIPPNRDTVSEKYLQDIYAEVLNAMHELMREDDFRETWVRNAMESQRPEPEAVRDTILGRYGEKAVTWSTDTEANMQAAEEGYQVVHPRNMSREELKTMREKGGLQSAAEDSRGDPGKEPPGGHNWGRRQGGFCPVGRGAGRTRGKRGENRIHQGPKAEGAGHLHHEQREAGDDVQPGVPGRWVLRRERGEAAGPGDTRAGARGDGRGDVPRPPVGRGLRPGWGDDRNSAVPERRGRTGERRQRCTKAH